MGFINVNHKQTIDSLTQGFKDRMKNPYYLYNDKSPIPVTYYTINKEMSSLDEGLKNVDSDLGSSSPMRFNKINNFFLYGMGRIELSLEGNEFGIQSGGLEGEALVLPNTIVPTPGEYFTVHHLNNHYLFKVISVNKDTLESGANFYKIEYKFESITDKNISKYVIDEYDTMVNNVGTDFKVIIKSTDYKFIEVIEDSVSKFIEYYNALFYNDRVDSYTFVHNGANIYDPIVTEFLIKNNILSGNNYRYITQQVSLPKTFALDYDRTIYRAIELKDKDKFIKANKFADIKPIHEPLSLLSMRVEIYNTTYHIRNTEHHDPLKLLYPIMDRQIETHVELNNTTNTIDDIIIKFLNDGTLSSSDIGTIESINYENSVYLFYRMPLIIYILNTYIKKLLKEH